MANTVEIIIKATDKYSATVRDTGSKLKGLSAGFEQLTGVSLTTAGVLGAAGMAIKGLINYTEDALAETMKYANEVESLGRLTGDSAEETSRLIQATDDVKISYESLTTALQAGVRKGIDVSVDGLKRLSGQYLALNPGVERSKFLMDNFGRSGADMGKLLELGADGIEEQMDAVSDSLVMTKAAIETSNEYYQALDRLTDAQESFKIAVGKDSQQSVADWATVIAYATEKSVEAYEAQDNSGKGYMATKRAVDAANPGIHKMAENIRDESTAADDAADPTEDLKDEVKALGSSTSVVSQYFNDLTEEMIFNKLAANMTADAALALGVQMGLVDPMTYSLSLKMDDLTTKYDTNRDGVIDAKEATSDYYDEVKKLQDAVDDLHSKTIDLTINWKGEGGGIGGAELLSGRDLNGNGIVGQAYGGQVAGRTPYIVGERGPELFVPNASGKIIPNSELGTGSGLDYDRMADALVQALQRSSLVR